MLGKLTERRREMGERRHFLVRESYAKHNEQYLVFSAGSAGGLVLKRDGQWFCNTGAFTDGKLVAGHTQRDIDLAPDGTVFGHKLSPGGGPVDVSEWFPRFGRVCINCGWVQGKACIEPSDPIRAITCERWKPRRQDVTEHINSDPRGYLGGGYMDMHAPAIPPGEEGGRKMLQTWEYEVWQKEKAVEDEPNEPRKRLVEGQFITGASNSEIRELVIWKHREDIEKASCTPADVEVVARPFAR
jgi:hypothetical protein